MCLVRRAEHLNKPVSCTPTCTITYTAYASGLSKHTLWTSRTVPSEVGHSLVHSDRDVAELQVDPPGLLCCPGDHNHALWRLRHAMECKRPCVDSAASGIGAFQRAKKHGRLIAVACGACAPIEHHRTSSHGTLPLRHWRHAHAAA